ncbi:MAG: hypothetical protein M1508_14490 [Nitrospirae bacterium]|nr:hypothetical protein [Nitrospirota bacterium]MCL5421407.1 hypothetical protein [Nitrospirota bacterium]
MNITQRPLGISREITVTDHFSIDHSGDAILTRKILYSNRSESTAIPIDLSDSPINFFFDCSDFFVQLNDESVSYTLKKDGFTTKLYIQKPQFLLAAQNVSSLTIGCKWKAFKELITSNNFTFSYHERASYTFSIENLIPEDMTFFVRLNEVRLSNDQYERENDSLKIPNIPVDKNNDANLRILILSTIEYLPTLLQFSTPPSALFSKCIIIFVQHLLSDFLHLIKAFEKNGANKDAVLIVGIPYSTKSKTVEALRILEYPNIETPSDYESPPFDDFVRKTIEKALFMSEATGNKILVIEDGGYVVPLLHREYINRCQSFIGAVEQTANGIWRDRDLETNGIHLKIPVMNVAESKLKDTLESPLIGDAVFKSIQDVLGKRGIGVRGKEVALNGYGRTGSHIAKTFTHAGAHVTVYDKDPIKRNAARSEGFAIAEDLRDIVSGNAKIIVGATGQKNPWLSTDEILKLGHNVYFASASSKRLEINHQELKKLTKKKTHLTGVGAKYELLTNNIVILLADGYPINFFEGESVPDIEIGFIPTLLFESAKLVVTESLGPGIVEVPTDLQEKIAYIHGELCQGRTT